MQTWKQNRSITKKMSSKIRTMFRNNGKSYENDKGVLVTKIERKESFDNFYNSGMNFDKQNIVITPNVEILAKKTTNLAKEGVTSKPKEISRKYLINGKHVCKELFLATFHYK